MKVGYSATFPNLSNGKWIKVWAEDEFTGSSMEDARKMWYDIKKGVENFYYESSKADEKKAEVKKDESKPIDIIANLNSCTDIKILEAYRLIVKGKPDLEAAYNNRLKELT